MLLQVKLNSSKMFRHEEKLTLVPVKTFLKNSANIITAFKTGFTVYLICLASLRMHMNTDHNIGNYDANQQAYLQEYC